MTKSNWILLSEARSKLLKTWLLLFALMTIFLLIQTSTGMIQGIKRIVWGWHFLCLFPGLVLLLGSTWLMKHTDKALALNVYRSLLGLILFYLMLILLVFIFSRKAIAMNDYGLDVYYPKSLWILAPINFLIICGLGIVLFLKESTKNPNSEGVLQLIQEKIEVATANQHSFQVSCFNSIRNGEIKEALENISLWFEKKDTETYSHLILLQARYNLLQKDINLNTINKHESQILLNKIMVALIDIINDIEG
jgi:Effector-associated domain 11